MRSSWLLTAILILTVTLGCNQDPTNKVAPPPEVPVFVTKAERIPIKQDFVGQIYGYKDIAIQVLP